MGRSTMRLSLPGLVVGALMLSAVSRAPASVYHISASGDDASRGSSASPWRTLAKANNAATAGDVVIVHGGEFADGIRPANSGSSGSPIVFQAAPGEHPVLTTSTGIDLGPGSAYITVEGLEIHARYRVVQIVGSSFITIRHCQLYGGRGNYSGFSVDGASYCVIQNNYYDRQDPDGSSVSGTEPTGGDGLRLIGNSNHNLIEGNTVTGCEHVAMASSYSTPTVYQSYNIWRNN